MHSRPKILSVAPVVAVLFASSPNTIGAGDPIWGFICTATGHARPIKLAALTAASSLPTAHCGATPAGFHDLTSVGAGEDTSVSLKIGYDPDTQRLCYVTPSLPEAPVIRVGVSHRLTVTLTNTLHDTGQHNTVNCPIDVFGGERSCAPLPHFVERPGADGKFYPLMANEAHRADGTSNLHVHGLFVSPQPCSDEVLDSTIYPANWGGPVASLQPCQSAPNSLAYSYDLPADHPAGLYWYHAHRHGEAEHETQMGLVGAIVVEDRGDAWRRSIGVTDEVLVIGDTPRNGVVTERQGCLADVACDAQQQSAATADRTARLTPSADAAAASSAATVPLDPRIDQTNQAGECAQGAYGNGNAGGTESWTLVLNGAAVPDNDGFHIKGINPVLHKTMRPGQRQIFRLANASADSFIAPQLVLSQNGVRTIEQLEVFARDGVGLADAQGNRHFGYFNVSKGQLIVPPAGRVEFVVHAPPVGAKLYLDSARVNPGCAGNAYPRRRLLMVTSAGQPVDPGAPDDSDLLEHTPSLRPYLSTLGGAPTVHRTLVFSEYGRGFTYGVTKWLTGPPTKADYDPDETDFYITQVAADDGEVDPQRTAIRPFVAGNLTPQVVVHLHGKESVTEEWLVENSTLEIHAFHMHQIHFRDVTVASANPDLQPILDTVTVPAAPLIGDIATGYPGAPGFVKLRMTFTKADIGEFVFHCHILEHEDNGMMAKIQVVAD